MPEQSTYALVVDSNILFSNTPFDQSVPWKQLLLYAGKYVDVDFIVPEIVVHERARHEADRIKKRRSEGATALHAARRALKSAGIEIPETPTVQELRALVLESREQLSDRMRAGLVHSGVVVAAIPRAAHEILVSWSIDSHPPFDSTDKGYRDALIWHTVRDVAAAHAEGSTILFVTADGDYTQKNHKSSGQQPELHPKLVDDLTRVTSNTVVVVRSLEEGIALIQAARVDRENDGQSRESAASVVEPTEVNTDDKEPSEEEVDALEDLDFRPSLHQLLRERMEGACQELVGEDIGSSYERYAQKFDFDIPNVENTSVAAIDPDMSTMSIDVHEQFEGEVIIGAVSVQAEIRFEGYVYKADAYSVQGTWEWEVVNWEWNDHYVLVEGYLQVELIYRFTFDNEAVAFEFDSARLTK